MEFVANVSSQYKDLQEFLTKHSAAKNTTASTEERVVTHTRIGNKELNVYGGSYCIPKEELPIFRRLYYEHVFVKNNPEYLTEAQFKDAGPILVDFDFRYNYNVTKRQHTTEHIQDMVDLYLNHIKDLCVLENNKPFPIIIMEKPNVNRVEESQITKDGIHMIIGIHMDRISQIMLREKVVNSIGDVWDLELTNTWDKVLDDGITFGHTNWQMYGSRKPGYDVYKVTYYLTASYDHEDDSWTTTAKSVKDMDLLHDLALLSAQQDGHAKFEIHPNIREEHAARTNASVARKPKRQRTKVNLVVDEDDELRETIAIEDIKDAATLAKAVDQIMSTLLIKEHYVKETHDYTQVLPEKYYEPGSHLLNRKVAFALKHTDERLFLSWVMLRSKASDFDYDTIPALYNDWMHHFNKKPNGITRASIMYWAKQDAFEAYEQVKQHTIDYYIEETIFEAADWDYAMVLYHMFKDKYVCSSITHKHWYVFNKNKWEKDEGQRLRMAISKDLFELYNKKQTQCLSQDQQNAADAAGADGNQRKVKKLAEICIKLKKTNDKNNIMREAMEIFFDQDFIKNTDSNPYLLCFTNGVFDFKAKEFRKGYPQDYITKTTGVPYNPVIDVAVAAKINTFMEQLFPEPELNRYMWDHLASVLIGVKKEQVFNMYKGSGSNGKSILTELMGLALGDYKGVVPINLISDKRTNIGSATPEIMKLKGIRYAVMQEPTEGMVINEGVLKELTGGDPLLGRALYCDSETFIPQFSLVVCTNSLFEIKSNDDGTWRRMKLVDFMAKFVSDDEMYTDQTPYVFPKNKELKEDLPIWAPMFVSMLVQRACETNGIVKDCPQVITASKNYRQTQDAITGFINDKLEKCEISSTDLNGRITILPGNVDGVNQTSLNEAFKSWYATNFSNKSIPKCSKLLEVIEKQFGKKNNKNKWHNIRFKEDDTNHGPGAVAVAAAV